MWYMRLVPLAYQLQVRVLTTMSVQYNTTTKAREYPDVGHGAASHHGVGDQFAVNGNAAQFNAVGQAEQYNFSGASSSMNVFIGEFIFYRNFVLRAVQQPWFEQLPHVATFHVTSHRLCSQKAIVSLCTSLILSFKA